MELSAPANYDIGLVPSLTVYPVTDVYGKLPYDIVGGGRASFSSSPVTFEHMERYIAELQLHGIGFTYLLNSACLGNREWSRQWQKKLFRFIARLRGAGVSGLTISTPLLFKLIKKNFPEFYLKVGIFAQVDTPSRARYWEGLGADEITLESFSINRDFKKLTAIRRSVSCRLQLIVNHPCLPNCPMQVYHQNGLSHASDGSGGLFIDYCFLMCSCERLKDPSLFIKSQWIRPEDLSRYEQLGFDRFKLLERSIPSAELLRRVEAYGKRTSPPDFADLILPYGFSQKTEKKWNWFAKYFFKPLQIRPSRLASIYRLIKQQGMLFPLEDRKIHIDASMIPEDFLDRFRQIDCTMTACQNCDYCSRIAEKAVTVDPVFRQRALEQYEQVDRMITNGELWDV